MKKSVPLKTDLLLKSQKKTPKTADSKIYIKNMLYKLYYIENPKIRGQTV